MPAIILTTLNARYWHSSFGLRYLMANMEELAPQTKMLEFGIGDRPIDMISTILAEQPQIVGIGVYIWNVGPVTQLVADLRRIRPGITIVLGGPEVSYETADQPLVQHADFVITGEGDLAFAELCRTLLSDRRSVDPSVPRRSIAEIIHGGAPDLADVSLPYEFYNSADIAHRVIYVEASRGCPFSCEFCLSALDIPVRLFDLDQFLVAMQRLLDQGAKQFKFVDRTFNLNMNISSAILQFFLDRYAPEMFLHFEMIPDRLPDSLRRLIAQFPTGALQFEIGVQTFNDEVGALMSRRQNNERLEDNFRFLRQHTGVHIHADLIIGLPGETLESFATGFDRLVRLQPQEIQVGILKRLKGTPITRHDADWDMVYSSHPPFEILSNRLIEFETMHRLRRFARFWDLVANSGNFSESVTLIWSDHSPFWKFLEFSDWIYEVEQKTHTIPLRTLLERLFQFLIQNCQLPAEVAGPSLLRDYARGGRRDIPEFLRVFHDAHHQPNAEPGLPPRQARHRG